MTHPPRTTHCQGARINGRIASLARELKNSETVEIITSPSAKPSRDWLAHVRTGRARHKIRQRLRIEEHTTSIKLGERPGRNEAEGEEMAQSNGVKLGISFGTVTPAIARELKLNRPAFGRVPNRIADQIDQDLDDRPLLPARTQGRGGIDRDRDLALFRGRF